ncbi:50S ribosomal protein L32e [Candidatus Micrarchaeota archaeon]|nr:50S ribosomal protein L32e [Candidatus Micrarchaeota archaeon]
MKKRSHPTFSRANFKRKDRKRVKDNWRKPRGIDNKKRLKIKYMGREPNIGWRNSKETRYLHPSGLKEVLIYNSKDLNKHKGKCLRIAHSVGMKKKTEIVQKATELGIKVVNP